jgi:hypothetical protein
MNRTLSRWVCNSTDLFRLMLIAMVLTVLATLPNIAATKNFNGGKGCDEPCCIITRTDAGERFEYVCARQDVTCWASGSTNCHSIDGTPPCICTAMAIGEPYNVCVYPAENGYECDGAWPAGALCTAGDPIADLLVNTIMGRLRDCWLSGGTMCGNCSTGIITGRYE